MSIEEKIKRLQTKHEAERVAKRAKAIAQKEKKAARISDQANKGRLILELVDAKEALRQINSHYFGGEGQIRMDTGEYETIDNSKEIHNVSNYGLSVAELHCPSIQSRYGSYITVASDGEVLGIQLLMKSTIEDRDGEIIRSYALRLKNLDEEEIIGEFENRLAEVYITSVTRD